MDAFSTDKNLILATLKAFMIPNKVKQNQNQNTARTCLHQVLESVVVGSRECCGLKFDGNSTQGSASIKFIGVRIRGKMQSKFLVKYVRVQAEEAQSTRE